MEMTLHSPASSQASVPGTAVVHRSSLAIDEGKICTRRSSAYSGTQSIFHKVFCVASFLLPEFSSNGHSAEFASLWWRRVAGNALHVHEEVGRQRSTSLGSTLRTWDIALLQFDLGKLCAILKLTKPSLPSAQRIISICQRRRQHQYQTLHARFVDLQHALPGSRPVVDLRVRKK